MNRFGFLLFACLMLFCGTLPLGFSQQEGQQKVDPQKATPKQIIERLESRLRFEVSNRDIALVWGRNAEIALRNTNGKLILLTRAFDNASTDDERTRLDQKIRDCNASIRQINYRLQLHRNTVETHNANIREISVMLRGAKAKTNAMMDARQLEIFFDKLDEGETAAEMEGTSDSENGDNSKYPHIQLPVPESALSTGNLKTWREIQKNERMRQFIIWKMNAGKRKFLASKETVGAVYDGGIPNNVAVTYFDELTFEYGKITRKLTPLHKKLQSALEKMGQSENMEDSYDENGEYYVWLIVDRNGQKIRGTVTGRLSSLEGDRVYLESPAGTKKKYSLDDFWEEEQKIIQALASQE